MKPALWFAICLLLLASVASIACKKENYVITTPPTPSAKSIINFHLKDTSTFGWGEPIYLYRLIMTPTSNIYDSKENIYLRPNIDTTFKYEITGNTNNLFTVGGDPFNGIIIYMEQKFIAAGSSINWDITY